MRPEDVIILIIMGVVGFNITITMCLYVGLASEFDKLRADIRRLETRTVPRGGGGGGGGDR